MSNDFRGHGPGPGPVGPPSDIARLSHSELVQRVKKLEVDLIKLASGMFHFT